VAFESEDEVAVEESSGVGVGDVDHVLPSSVVEDPSFLQDPGALQVLRDPFPVAYDGEKEGVVAAVAVSEAEVLLQEVAAVDAELVGASLLHLCVSQLFNQKSKISLPEDLK
jgi:hypothetical protein